MASRSIRNPLGLGKPAVSSIVERQATRAVTMNEMNNISENHMAIFKKKEFWTSIWMISVYVAVIVFFSLLFINPPIMHAHADQIVLGKKVRVKTKHISVIKLLMVSLGFGVSTAAIYHVLQSIETMNIKSQYLKVGGQTLMSDTGLGLDLSDDEQKVLSSPKKTQTDRTDQRQSTQIQTPKTKTQTSSPANPQKIKLSPNDTSPL